MMLPIPRAQQDLTVDEVAQVRMREVTPAVSTLSFEQRDLGHITRSGVASIYPSPRLDTGSYNCRLVTMQYAVVEPDQ